MRQKKSASILRKFLLFNLGVFSILGLFTIIYLKAIQPSLIKKRTADHSIIINNTIDHLQRLNIDFNEKDIKTFLLSTRFLFQGLDRVQFFDINGNLIADTNILDLDQDVFSKPGPQGMNTSAIYERGLNLMKGKNSAFANDPVGAFYHAVNEAHPAPPGKSTNPTAVSIRGHFARGAFESEAIKRIK